MNLSKDLIIILAIVLLLFGPSRLAGLGGVLGKTIRDFRKSLQGDDQDDATKPAPPKSDSITH